MPKLKTKKAAAKRFKITSSGKVKRERATRKHLLEHKSPGSKRAKRRTMTVNPSDMKKVKRMLHGLVG